MVSKTAAKLAAGASLALCAGMFVPGIASAKAALPDQVDFSATDNGDCTATFTIINKTNSDTNRVVYWTGPTAPKIAPPYTDDRGSTIAVYSGVAESVTTWAEGGGYQDGLDPVTTSTDVDFSDVANGAETVHVAYRMTGLERDAYDTGLKELTVTGCGDQGGFLGSLDIFGSLSSLS